jgi:predicted ribosomally synthesized peptide with SipW-like signal peptide
MTRPEISRREVLAGLGGIGVVGAVSGAGTRAFLTDEESFGGSIRSGSISIDIGCDSCIVDDGGVSFALGDIERGDSGTETLDIGVETNPARLWLQSDCPSTVDPLGDALVVTIRYDGITIESGTLSSVRRSLRGGTALSENCTTPGETTGFEIEWKLPLDTPKSVAGEQTSFEFEFLAEQCRHVDGDGNNPFDGSSSCEEPDECVPCPGSNDRIAEATFEYDGPGEALVKLFRAGRPPGREGSESGDVLFEALLSPGESFATVLYDPPDINGWLDVGVDIDGTFVGDFHLSCSELFGPGLVIGDGVYSLTVLEAVDTAGNTICEVNNE